jgi:hypothetical protein
VQRFSPLLHLSTEVNYLTDLSQIHFIKQYIKQNSIMKSKTQLLMTILALILMASCDKVEYQSLSFYSDYREVPIHGTAFISPKTGSGNYTLEVENPLLISTEMQTGWSSETGMIAIQGKLTGNTWLTVTDNATKESQKLRIKVIDNYETMRITKAYKTDKGEVPPFPASLSNIEWISLVNNKARDFYLINRESISHTDYVLKVRGKGTYTLDKEGEDYRFTFSFLVDENGQPTLDEGLGKTVSYCFRTSMNGYALHRLNQNLNLVFDTSMPTDWKEFITNEWDTVVMMEGIDTEYKMYGSLLPGFEIPVGFLK